MMAERFCWLSLCLLLLCGSSLAHAQDNVTVQFYYPVAVGGEITKTIAQRVAEFESLHPSIHIEPIYSGTYKESLDKVLVAEKSGTPPTFAVLHAVDMHTLIDAGIILPFDDLIANEDSVWLNDFEPAFMSNSREAGKLWGIPFQRSTILLYWNKVAFREAGLSAERPPQNWDEMRSMAKKLTVRDASGKVTRWGIQIPSSGFPYWLFQGWVATNGGTLMNSRGTETYFDSPAAVEALQYWIDLARVDQVHPAGIVEWRKTPEDFIQQRAAMIWTTSGNLTHIARHADFDFGVSQLPRHNGVGAPTGGGNFYIFKKSTAEQRKAALNFIKWMTSPEQAARWSMDTGYIPVQKSAWNQPALQQYAQGFPAARVARAALENAKQELSTHENQRVTKVLNDALAAAISGEKPSRQALREAQSKAVSILRPYQR